MRAALGQTWAHVEAGQGELWAKEEASKDAADSGASDSLFVVDVAVYFLLPDFSLFL